MTWEIWHLAQDDSGRILEVLPFGDDEGEARAKFNDIQETARVMGGTYELRRDGKYIFHYSVTLGEAKG